MNFRPASLKVNNVHIGFHQLDAAAMLGKGIRQRAVACCFFEVESISLVRHDDGYFPARPAAAANVHFCVGVLVTAVHDGIPPARPRRYDSLRLPLGSARGRRLAAPLRAGER